MGWGARSVHTARTTKDAEIMHRLALAAIRLALIWAVSTGIIWVSVRLVGRKLALLDAGSVAFLGSLLSVGVLFLGLFYLLGAFIAWTVLLWFLCRIRFWRAAISSAAIQLLALIAFHVI
jgi:hypothetical protein